MTRADRPPFTDTHVHFFDMTHPRLRFDWLPPGGDPAETAVLGEYGAVRSERYWADDYVGETRLHDVARVIHVQCAIGSEDPAEETRWLQAFHDRLGIPHAAIGYADLADPEVGALLERHRAYPIFRGIRDLREDDYLTDPQWEQGFALLGEHGLVCCDAPALEQAGAAAAIAARHPGVTYCVDHALMPLRRDAAYFAQWRDGLRTLAQVPSTVVKISGLGQVDHRWTVDSLRPWVLACVEEFGVERAFFGSNWPVDRLYSGFGDLLDAYAEIVADFTPGERAALFGGTANRVFGIS
ncbi:amidohydrolase family protein [Conexibacter arvalis]|uniref:Putative TIM-barrel fold metal-dependent hydrolase n=1 Tax=Conexibacter arvalis TaxID=912552 RepID=A0A840I8L6_9ACTN|nr:amidohydrolase family protein [Conexibacter arvalis]MBB4660494.1 putative TIM-barrel fold metal-dependent hydrolase [Conexibacter arvalis]